ncbi:MAG: hypothetical protein IPO92_11780 [Saprospiraceae bacterium]|nr:hypothetical protein [Saprospiraceae bacterium]
MSHPFIGTKNGQQITDITGRFYSVLLLSNLFYAGNQQGLYWGRPSKDELFPICLDENEEAISVNGILQSSDGLLGVYRWQWGVRFEG